MRLTSGCVEYVLVMVVSEERESVQMRIDSVCERGRSTIPFRH